MNTPKRLFTLLALTSSFIPLAQATEYKTMYATSDAVILNVLPSDLVEVISGYNVPGDNYPNFSGQLENDTWINSYFSLGSPLPPKLTGIKALRLNPHGVNYPTWITVKITPKEETTAAGPTSVLVIPENSTGNYDVVVESSGDMTTWTPFVSQTVQSSTPSNFFRVRIVKK